MELLPTLGNYGKSRDLCPIDVGLESLIDLLLGLGLLTDDQQHLGLPGVRGSPRELPHLLLLGSQSGGLCPWKTLFPMVYELLHAVTTESQMAEQSQLIAIYRKWNLVRTIFSLPRLWNFRVNEILPRGFSRFGTISNAR